MTSPKPLMQSVKQSVPEKQEFAAGVALSSDEVAILAETFRLLGDPSRLKILLSCMSGPISVSEIAKKLELSLSLVSHHLRHLRSARLVKGMRQSKHIFYEIADQHVSQVLQDMATHISEDQIGK